MMGDSTVVVGWAEELSEVTEGANDSNSGSNDAEGGDGLLVARVNGDASGLVAGNDADGVSRAWRWLWV